MRAVALQFAGENQGRCSQVIADPGIRTRFDTD